MMYTYKSFKVTVKKTPVPANSNEDFSFGWMSEFGSRDGVMCV